MIYTKAKMDDENYELTIMTNAIIDEPMAIDEEYFKKADNDLDILSIFISLIIKTVGKESDSIQTLKFKYADMLVPEIKDNKYIFVPMNGNQKRSIA